MDRKNEEQLVSMFKSPCIVCKKKMCYFVIVGKKEEFKTLNIGGICSGRCEQQYRNELTKTSKKIPDKNVIDMLTDKKLNEQTPSVKH